MGQMTEPDLIHLAGVFDAIGVITVSISKKDSYKVGYEITPIVRITSSRNDNRVLMGKIIEYCDQQGVRYGITEKENTSDAKSDKIEIKRTESIQRFLEPILPSLVAKFEEATIMLEEIIPRIEDDKHRSKEGVYELMEFADMIRGTNKRGPTLKYDQAYFKKEWDL